MSNVARLKKKATEFEQKKQFDKALGVYQQILAEGGGEEEGDVTLYNRVGDLLLRQGNVPGALEHYEKAVDLYADGGFFNNAIALCNKILRQSPGRSSIYYKLGKISAKKGFKSDAKQNFLEYADRMQKAGQIDEAFRALKEFADLCPDQDDIRLMLAEQLAKKERKGEALEQLQTLYERLDSEGRGAEARATLDRMKAIDPAAEPKASGQQQAQKPGDLVFLDVDYDAPPKGGGPPTSRGPRTTAPPGAPKQVAGRPGAPPATSAPAPSTGLSDQFYVPPGVAEPPALRDARPEAAPLPGLELGSTFGGAEPGETGNGLGLELSGAEALSGMDAGGGLLDLTPTAFEAGSAESLLEAAGSVAPLVEIELAEVEHFHAPPAEHDLSLPGELPPLALPGEEGGPDLPLIIPEGVTLQGGGSLLDQIEPPLSRPDAPPADLNGDYAFELDRGGSLLDAPLGSFGDSPLDSSSGGLDDGVPLIELEDPPPAPPPPPVTPLPPAPRGVGRVQPPGPRVVPPPPARAPAVPVPAPPARVPAPPPTATAPRPAPAAPTGATAGETIESLRAGVARNAGDAGMRRRLAEALLEGGAREEGMQELEAAMISWERLGDLDSANSIADEIIRLTPNSVRHHQKRVEYAFRTNDKARLTDAYLELADALFRSGQPDKAKAVYQRVLGLAPDDARAKAALNSFVETTLPAEPRREKPDEPEPKTETGRFRRYTAEVKRAAAVPSLPPLPEPAAKAPSASEASFVNLGDWLRDTQKPKSTRMVVAEQAPTGDEQADFAEMLRRFKQGVAENVEDEDHQSHYDLGVAYKEMGLLDEAIGEFQKALRGTDRVRTYEALGQCFLERSQFQVASSLLARALAEPGHGDDDLVGVLYLLGYASEGLQQWDSALGYYQRVFAVDIQFRDVGDRITALERAVR